ncbi:hypothetical protein VIBNISOn1_1050018 [Vibrio nigripulchritudo SOn1]|uniref:Uncharacterized protein n=1 Tax=Vibrio nigripulchritudo SOn1 TaxID=1238450 RepID=A0AAV2VHT1_9VIBR|nr:hypothetical protein [Vibrio nigripulchritudo]CCO44192.1 hypothetical protein VIBNISOn1_1050018 [Vibrio nigripulchritudo SOn1]
MKTDWRAQERHIADIQSKGHETHTIGSIHHFDRDFRTVVYTEDEQGEIFRHTIAFTDPHNFDINKGHYEIWNIGENTEIVGKGA